MTKGKQLLDLYTGITEYLKTLNNLEKDKNYEFKVKFNIENNDFNFTNHTIVEIQKIKIPGFIINE